MFGTRLGENKLASSSNKFLTKQTLLKINDMNGIFTFNMLLNENHGSKVWIFYYINP